MQSKIKLRTLKPLNPVTFMEKFFWWWFSEYVCLSTNIENNRVKKYKGTDYIIGQASKDLFKYKLLPVQGDFLPKIYYFTYKIEYTSIRTILFYHKTIIQPRL